MKRTFENNLRYDTYSSKDGGYTVYAVYGEDSNADMGGYHSNPFLGNVEGTFKDVIEYAANNISRFYTWGGGGYIVPISTLDESVKPIVLNSAKKLKKSRKEKLNHLAATEVEKLIENFESMTDDEIRESLNDLKFKIKIGKNKL